MKSEPSNIKVSPGKFHFKERMYVLFYLISYNTCCVSNKHILLYNRAFISIVKGLQGKGNFAILIQHDFHIMKFTGAYVCGLSCKEGVVCVNSFNVYMCMYV